MTNGQCSPSSLTYPLSVLYFTLRFIQTYRSVFSEISTSIQVPLRLAFFEFNKRDCNKDLGSGFLDLRMNRAEG